MKKIMFIEKSNKGEFMEKRIALGKGLASLIPTTSSGALSEKTEEVHYLDINKVFPNEKQPRKNFNNDEISSLAESIKENGIIQPIIVRRKGENFEIIAGERRWMASKTANLDKIPVIVRNLNDKETLEIALIENIQREDLTCIETAMAYQKLISEFNYTQDGLSKKVGKDRTTVSNHLRLLKLPTEIKDDLLRKVLTMGHARALLAFENEPEKQIALWKEIIEKKLSVRDIENIVNKTKGFVPRKKANQSKDIFITSLEDALKRALATKVKIISDKLHKGKIVIEFYSQDELNTIVDFLKNRSTEEKVALPPPVMTIDSNKHGDINVS